MLVAATDRLRYEPSRRNHSFVVAIDDIRGNQIFGRKIFGSIAIRSIPSTKYRQHEICNTRNPVIDTGWGAWVEKENIAYKGVAFEQIYALVIERNHQKYWRQKKKDLGYRTKMIDQGISSSLSSWSELWPSLLSCSLSSENQISSIDRVRLQSESEYVYFWWQSEHIPIFLLV